MSVLPAALNVSPVAFPWSFANLRRRGSRRDINELMRMARATRVQHQIRPYVEVLVA